MASKGYGALWSLLMSALAFGGSMQYVAITLLTTAFDPLQAFLLSVMVNARHIFYGLGMLEKFRGLGKRFPYMAFALTDETYSVLCSMDAPTGMDWNDCAFYVSMFDQCYWVLGSLLGSLLGQALPVDLTGIDFSMTALFVVIFVDQWKQFPSHVPALTGLTCAVAARLLFGPDNFLLIALIAAVAILAALRGRLEGEQ